MYPLDYATAEAGEAGTQATQVAARRAQEAERNQCVLKDVGTAQEDFKIAAGIRIETLRKAAKELKSYGNPECQLLASQVHTIQEAMQAGRAHLIGEGDPKALTDQFNALEETTLAHAQALAAARQEVAVASEKLAEKMEALQKTRMPANARQDGMKAWEFLQSQLQATKTLPEHTALQERIAAVKNCADLLNQSSCAMSDMIEDDKGHKAFCNHGSQSRDGARDKRWIHVMDVQVLRNVQNPSSIFVGYEEMAKKCSQALGFPGSFFRYDLDHGDGIPHWESLKLSESNTCSGIWQGSDVSHECWQSLEKAQRTVEMFGPQRQNS